MWSAVKGPTKLLRWDLLIVTIVLALNFKVSGLLLVCVTKLLMRSFRMTSQSSVEIFASVASDLCKLSRAQPAKQVFDIFSISLPGFTFANVLNFCDWAALTRFSLEISFQSRNFRFYWKTLLRRWFGEIKKRKSNESQIGLLIAVEVVSRILSF